MFQDFKLNIDVVILDNFNKKLGKILFNFLVTLAPNKISITFLFLLNLVIILIFFLRGDKCL
jgi:hypothetical protein